MECQSAVLLRRLNYNDAKSLEGAASLSLTRAHAEITPEHWLLKITISLLRAVSAVIKRHALFDPGADKGMTFIFLAHQLFMLRERNQYILRQVSTVTFRIEK